MKGIRKLGLITLFSSLLLGGCVILWLIPIDWVISRPRSYPVQYPTAYFSNDDVKETDDWSTNAENRRSNYYLSSAKSNEIEKSDILYDGLRNITFVKMTFGLSILKTGFTWFKTLLISALSSPQT